MYDNIKDELELYRFKLDLKKDLLAGATEQEFIDQYT